MEFRTTFSIAEAENLLDFGDAITLLGSCFSDRIGNKLRYYGFDVLTNPFGTLFHPLAIANLLEMNENASLRTLKNRDTWLAFDAHSELSATSEAALQDLFVEKCVQLQSYLFKSKLLVITLGSAWGYYLNEKIVANCHKRPAADFKKRLTDLETMQTTWQRILTHLKQNFPQLEVMFTLSPVRHTKDGFIENQRSKARLTELVHSLDANYFPSYELLMDDLRDYRFYESDMIHPNAQAVDYIFDHFTMYKVSASSSKYFPVIHKFRMFEAHQIKPFDQDRFEEHQQEVALKRSQLCCQISGLCI